MPRTHVIVVPDSCRGERLDLTLAGLFPDYSRMRLKQWIEGGQVRVDGAVRRPRDRVAGGERIELDAAPEPAPASVVAQPIMTLGTLLFC